jgi:hypothetical protein
MNKQTIAEYKQAVRRGRSKKFNDWVYTSKNTLAGKTIYQPKQK